MMSLKKIMIFTFSAVVGGLFIWAGILKIIDPLEFARNISNYRVLSPRLSLLVAIILPWIELLSGVFIIVGVMRRASALLISLLLVGFIALIGVTMLRGIDVDCGCFGSFSRKADFLLMAQDLGMLLLSGTVYFAFKPKSTSAERRSSR